MINNSLITDQWINDQEETQKTDKLLLFSWERHLTPDLPSATLDECQLKINQYKRNNSITGVLICVCVCVRRTDGRGRRCALAAELLQRVHSYIQIDVLTAASVIHHLLFIQSLGAKKTSTIYTSIIYNGVDINWNGIMDIGCHTIWKASCSEEQSFRHSSMKMLR